MTLGGLSLAVGILVDDATVELENVHRNMAMREAARAGHPRRRAADRGAGVRGDALHLHRLHPHRLHLRRRALALHAAGDGRRLRDDDVVFPVADARPDDGALPPRRGDAPLRRGRGRQRRSTATSSGASTSASTSTLRAAAPRLRRVPRLGARPPEDGGRSASWSSSSASVALLFPNLGRDFFPSVDAGQIRFHVRGQPGTRIETTEELFVHGRRHGPDGHPEHRARDDHRQHRTAHQRYQPHARRPVDDLRRPTARCSSSSRRSITPTARLRQPAASQVPRRLSDGRGLLPRSRHHHPGPELRLSARPSTCRSSAPSRTTPRTTSSRRSLRDRISKVRGAVDVHLAQVVNEPELRVDVDRAEASQQGLTQRDVANDTLVSLSSSRQVAPNFWLDTKSGRAIPRSPSRPLSTRSTPSTRSARRPFTSPGAPSRRSSATSPAFDATSPR